MKSDLKFQAASGKGEVSAILLRPVAAKYLLVLGHGASTNMRHATMQSIAATLAAAGIATFRYNFPYSERGGGRDSQAICVETVRNAVKAARVVAPDMTLCAGGHSFGGRMTSTAHSIEPLPDVKGIVFFSFPLHLPDRPDVKRAEHLAAIDVPMLFLSGTRDTLAELDLLEPIVKNLGKNASLHLLETADHSYKILKKTRTSKEDVFSEMARKIDEWIEENRL